MSNKTFLYTDQDAINSNIASVQNGISIFKPFYERYKELELPELTDLNFEEFFNNPKTFLVQKLTNGETLMLGSIKIDPVKAYELFPLPVGVEELVTAIENKKFEDDFNRSYWYALTKILIVNNELVVNPEYVTEITDKYTYHTETADQDTALTLITEISAKLTDLKILQKNAFSNSQDWVNDLLKPDTAKKVFTANVKIIRNF